MSGVWWLDLGICHFVSVWCWQRDLISLGLHLQGGRREIRLGEPCGTRAWRILTVKPRSPSSVKWARGSLQVSDESSTSGKLTWRWHIKWMELARRWRWRGPFEAFHSSVYERQRLIKWNSLNCVSALWVMSHYHKSPASPQHLFYSLHWAEILPNNTFYFQSPLQFKKCFHIYYLTSFSRVFTSWHCKGLFPDIVRGLFIYNFQDPPLLSFTQLLFCSVFSTLQFFIPFHCQKKKKNCTMHPAPCLSPSKGR